MNPGIRIDTGKMALGLPRPREVAVLDLCRHRALDTVVTSCRQKLQNAIAFTEVGTLQRNPVLHRKVGELSPMAVEVLLCALPNCRWPAHHT